MPIVELDPERVEEASLRIAGIRDSRCRCTSARLCRRCQVKGRFQGKFAEPWAEAVRADRERGER